MTPERLVAVIPAFNEAPAIGAVVQEVLGLVRGGRPLFEDVVVVDNGSTDGTAEIAAESGARIVSEPSRGYGAACLAGIAAAGGADAIVFVDGDASVELADTHRLLAPLFAGADLVIGARLEAPRAAMSFPQRFGNRLATALIRLLWRVPVSDLGPFRAIRRSALRALDMRDRTYGWTVEMQVKAIQRGLRTVEVPVRLRTRIGQSKISGTVRGVIGAAIGIFSMIGRLWLAQGLRASPSPEALLRRIATAPAVAPLTAPRRRNPCVHC